MLLALLALLTLLTLLLALLTSVVLMALVVMLVVLPLAVALTLVPPPLDCHLALTALVLEWALLKIQAKQSKESSIGEQAVQHCQVNLDPNRLEQAQHHDRPRMALPY